MTCAHPPAGSAGGVRLVRGGLAGMPHVVVDDRLVAATLDSPSSATGECRLPGGAGVDRRGTVFHPQVPGKIAGGSMRRNGISWAGRHGSRVTSARQIERTRTSPSSWPLRHLDRTNPSSRAPVTVAHASSIISRLSVSSHDSPRSGRPPGQPQCDPSVLTRTTFPLAVTQKALAPCACPAGTSTRRMPGHPPVASVGGHRHFLKIGRDPAERGRAHPGCLSELEPSPPE